MPPELATSTTLTNNAAPLSILAGLIDQDELQRQLNCSGRSVDRYRAVGLPVIVLGKRVLFDPVAVREWIVSHQRRHDAPSANARASRPPEFPKKNPTRARGAFRDLG